MKYIKSTILTALTFGLFVLCSKPLTIGGNTLPALGQFFNPFEGFWANTQESIESGAVFNFDNLSAEVQVKTDERGVPHIFAQNMSDALFVQGFITAKDRLWQMEITQRSAAGKLAEVFGERALASDTHNRRLGNLHYAKKRLVKWHELASEESKSYLEQYAKGVNAYINQLDPKDFPFEYKLFNHSPVEFEQLHSTLIVTKMAQRLCGREEDLESTNLLAILGPELFQTLYPEFDPNQSPIIADSNQTFYETPLPILDEEDTYSYQAYEKPNPSNGSNNWAVSGSKTKSGNPILCNDPHLGMTLPSVWYEIQIHTPEVNVYGVTLPGIPGVIIGFNEDIAWGVTNVSHDVTDFYEINWLDEAKTTYQYLDEIKQVESVQDTIWIAGQDPFIQTLKITEIGPVMFESDHAGDQDLIMRWLVNEMPQTFELSTFLDLCKAKNYEDYRAALRSYSIPAQNIVFADKHGDIALTVTGKFPLKEAGQGRFIHKSLTADNLWKGFIPFDSLPHAYNPEQAFVCSANQRSTGPNYPFYYNGFFDHYRGRILNQKLAAMDNITVEDMKQLQNDEESLIAQDLLPTLLDRLNQADFNSAQKGMIEHLQNWNGYYTKEDIAPVIFSKWWGNLYQLCWDEIETLQQDYAVNKPASWNTIALIKDQPTHPYFDIMETPEKETADELINQAFEKTYTELKDKINLEHYNWGYYWSTDIQHLSKLPALSRNGLEVGGYMHALKAIRGSHGPSWRMIVELGDYPKAYGVYPGGQSGNPASPLYDSNLDAWAAGEYFELQFLKGLDDNRFKTDYSTLTFKKS